jgi:predicted secreted protein
MSVMGAVLIFGVGWWLCFLVALPFGVRGQWEDDSTAPGTEEAAPKEPMLAKKAMWATLGAVGITGIAALIIPRVLAQ